MNFEVHIIDTQNSDYTTQLEIASKNSIELTYQGNDAKDEVSIVGSALSFDMEVPFNNNVDAAFIDLFTGDEQRYKIELKQEGVNTVIWNGFLLPDSYEEPYENGTFFVSFEAVDGLGRLKGKYLENEFYSEEKNVVLIIAKCLELTGLQMPLFFSPGVDNYAQKNWHQIYVDTATFVDKNKKLDAYSILEMLIEDTVSCVYQHIGSWYVEGLNKRNLLAYSAKKYSYTGVYIEDATVNKNVKYIQQEVLVTPNITMVAPYGVITVSHDREPTEFPATVAKEANDGWAITTGVVGKIKATDWLGHNNYYASAVFSDYYVTIYGEHATAFDINKYISLKHPIFLKQNTKANLKWSLKVLAASFYYDIVLGNEVLFSNRVGEITDAEVFDTDEDGSATLEFEFIAQNEGLLDIKLYRPYSQGLSNVDTKVVLNSLSVDVIGFEDEQIITETSEQDYTNVADISLTYADDATAFSKCFQLAKVKTISTTYNQIEVPILYGFSQNGINYSVVSLEGANLIKDNIYTTYFGATLLQDLEVQYNFQSGEEMVVLTNTLYQTGSFLVRVYVPTTYVGSRLNWEKWTDSIYQIEQLRYAQVVANIYKRMFAVPHPKLDLTVNGPILFQDILKYNYIAQANYYNTNCAWNIDSGESKITMVKAIYQNSEAETPGDNLPPIVEAGATIYLGQGVTQTTLTAEAFDPDGIIVAQQWEKIIGDSGDVIQNPTNLQTQITGLTGDLYEYQITVTDNDEATGSDTVQVVRIKDYTVQMVLVSHTVIHNEAHLKEVEDVYKIEVTPELPEGTSIQIEFNYLLKNSNNSELYLGSFNTIKVTKGIAGNTTVIIDDAAYENETNNTDEAFNYIAGNQIEIVSNLKVENEDPTFAPSVPEADVDYVFTITNVTFNQGLGVITNVPNNVNSSLSL